MLVLGIDPGLQRTGFAVLRVHADARQPTELVDAGVIRLNPKLSIPSRLVTLAQDLDGVINENRATHAGVESLFSHYRNPSTAIAMAHARGVILCTLARAGLPITELKPTAIKRSLTGHGHATKEQVAQGVAAILNLPAPPSPSDVADAIAIAHCAALRIASSDTLPSRN
ncbi:MAG: crossover junction endodeoxyribonuclease RuvC [Phycisphaerales bacterium]